MGDSGVISSEAVPCREVPSFETEGGEVLSTETGFSGETGTEVVLSLESTGCGEARGGVGVCADAECSECSNCAACLDYSEPLASATSSLTACATSNI